MFRLVLLLLPVFLCAEIQSSSERVIYKKIENVFNKFKEGFENNDIDQIMNVFGPDVTLEFHNFTKKFENVKKGIEGALNSSVCYSYAYEIKEILVAPDFVVVRVDWTVTSTDKATGNFLETNIEKGIDIFKYYGTENALKIYRSFAYEV